MIARTWSGRTRKEHADTYLEVITRTGIKGLTSTPGNLGAWLLRRIEGDQAHFLLISLWDSYESIRTFAGEDVEKAYYYPDDDPFLLEKAEFVNHFEVVHAPSAA